MDNYKKLIGKRIKSLREMKGYATQESFAEAIYNEFGIATDASRVSRWETGESKPSPKYRKPLCDLLGTNEKQLFAPADYGQNAKTEISKISVAQIHEEIRGLKKVILDHHQVSIDGRGVSVEAVVHQVEALLSGGILKEAQASLVQYLLSGDRAFLKGLSAQLTRRALDLQKAL